MPMRCEPEVVDALPGEFRHMNESAADTRSTISRPPLPRRQGGDRVLCDGLGFERHAVYEGENGTVMHAELSFGNGMIMLGSIKPTIWREPPQPDEIGMKETSRLSGGRRRRCGLPERQGGEVYLVRDIRDESMAGAASPAATRRGISGASAPRSLEGRRRLSGSPQKASTVDGARALRMRRASPL